MGTDIHPYFEVRNEDTWERIDLPHRWYAMRNYDLFGILANVRNGRGFAGCKTGEGFNVIAEPRGLPSDLATGYVGYDSGSEDEDFDWFGDHDHSWLTATEIIDFDWSQIAYRSGVVDALEYWEFKTHSRWDMFPQPKSWCGGISGPEICHVTQEDMDQIIARASDNLNQRKLYPSRNREEFLEVTGRVYTRMSWPVMYSQAAGEFYTFVMPQIKQLADKYGGGNVRMVFGFDS